MAQPFTYGATGPAEWGYAITPADGADLADHIRALTIGTAAGVVAYHDWNGNVRTTGSLPTGTYSMKARRILATGTTATGLTGWV